MVSSRPASARETVQLAPGGLWVELSKPALGQAGVLQDIDVLYLTPAGEVQLVEVKRSGEALEKTKGQYFDKFETWRDGGKERRLAVAIRFPGDGYLDKPLLSRQDSPRELLEGSKFELFDHPGR